MSTQVLSYGGGTQSVAMCVLVAQGRLQRPDFILIADTGREAQSTWDYLETYTRPLLAATGLAVDVAPHTLAHRDLYDSAGGPLMPLHTTTGMLRTFCSNEWKRYVMHRWLRAHGVPSATYWIGFTLEERHRAKTTDEAPWWRTYPLLDLMLARGDCESIIVQAGLPLPAKSACWCCPFRSNAEWRVLRDHYPADWQQAVALDDELRAADERGGVYLHRSRVPLAMADLDGPTRAGTESQCGLGLCML